MRRPEPADPCELLIGAADTVPSPALRGDLLLKAAGLCRPASRKLQLDIYERVFHLAANVDVAYPGSPVPVGFTDTVPALAAIASGLGVDRLSLKLRALNSLYALDPQTAREWFDSMAVPPISAQTCSDYQVANLERYYETLREFADHGFSGDEIGRGVREVFISTHLFPIHSAAHLAGAVYFLSEAELRADERRRLVSMATAQLSSLQVDDRAFSVFLFDEGVRNRLRVLVSRCEQAGVKMTGFLSTLREFYARQRAAPRCADVVESEPLSEREQLALRNADALLSQLSGAPLTPVQQVRSVKLLPSKRPKDLVATTPEYKRWFTELISREKPTEGAEPPASVFARVARQIEDWDEMDGMSAREFFQIKALVLARLMQQASGPDEAKRAASAQIRMFGRADWMQLQYPAVWLHLFRSFLSQCRRSTDAGNELRKLVEGDRDPAVSATARLDWAMRASGPAERTR